MILIENKPMLVVFPKGDCKLSSRTEGRARSLNMDFVRYFAYPGRPRNYCYDEIYVDGRVAGYTNWPLIDMS